MVPVNAVAVIKKDAASYRCSLHPIGQLVELDQVLKDVSGLGLDVNALRNAFIHNLHKAMASLSGVLKRFSLPKPAAAGKC